MRSPLRSSVTRWAIVILVAGGALAAGAAGYRLWLEGDRQARAVADLRALQLPDSQGRTRSLEEWQGKVLIVNFWATWCEPCREEVPALLNVRKKYAGRGVEIVGISIDSVPKVLEFAREFRIDYPLLMGGLTVIDLSRRLGNTVGALPYTVVLDPAGRVALAHLGGLSEQQLDRVLAPLLGQSSAVTSGIWWTKWSLLRQTSLLWPKHENAKNQASPSARRASSSSTAPT